MTESIEQANPMRIYNSQNMKIFDVLSILIHELNNKLNVVMSLVDDLEMMNESKEKKIECAESLKENIFSITHLCRSYTHVYANPKYTDSELYLLSDLIKIGISVLEKKLSRSKTKLTLELLATPMVKCSQMHFLQIFIFLIINSIEAQENIDSKWITVRTNIENGVIKIHIIDGGQISNKEIFQPWVTTKDKKFHLGLSLYIGKELMKQNLGTLELTSEHPTTFTMTLPLAT